MVGFFVKITSSFIIVCCSCFGSVILDAKIFSNDGKSRVSLFDRKIEVSADGLSDPLVPMTRCPVDHILKNSPEIRNVFAAAYNGMITEIHSGIGGVNYSPVMAQINHVISEHLREEIEAVIGDFHVLCTDDYSITKTIVSFNDGSRDWRYTFMSRYVLHSRTPHYCLNRILE